MQCCRSLNQSYELKVPNSHTGKRKVRRHANEKTLMVYLKDDDEDPNRLLESYKDPFARLMDSTSNPIESLNDFTYQLEQESQVDEHADTKEKTPYQRISNKIRRAMKIKKNFPHLLIENIENDIVGFFTSNPLDIFCCVPSKSFERLLFHAVSQYHGLSSVSLAKNGHVSVEVQNSLEQWLPIEVRLCQYLLQVSSS